MMGDNKFRDVDARLHATRTETAKMGPKAHVNGLPPTTFRRGVPRYFAAFSSHHQSRGSGFLSGQIRSSVSPSKSSPFFIT